MAAGLSAGVAFIDILPNMSKFTTELTSGMRKAGAAMTSIGRSLTHAITVPVALAAGAAVKMSLDFRSAMVRIQTQAGASAGQVRKMTDAVLKLSPKVATGPEDLAKGLYHVESVGYRSAKALNVLRTAAIGAKVGGSDLESTASALSAVLVTNIKGTENYGHAMGILNGIIGSGNMRMNDLVQALKSGIVPTAKIAGLSLKGIGAALSMMTDEGVPATTAANRLRTVMFMITNPTDKAKTALKSIGLHAKSLGHDMLKPDGVNVAMKDLREHLKDIKDPTQKLALIGSMFGGSRSAGTVAMLLNNLGRIHLKYQQISKVASKYAQDVERTRRTPQFKVDQAWAAIQVSMIKVGSRLLPIVVQLADDLARWATAFANLSPHMQKVIVYGALLLATLGPILTVVGSVITVMGVLGTAVGFVGTGLVALIGIIPGVTVTMEAGEAAMIGFGAAFDLSLGPIGLVALGITAVGLAAAGIYEYMSSTVTVTDQLAGVAGRAMDAVDGLNGALKNSKDSQHQANEAFTQARGAALAYDGAQRNVNKLLKEGKKGTLEYKVAVNQAHQAKQAWFDADVRASAAQEKANRAQNKAMHTWRRSTRAIGNLTEGYKKKTRADQADAKQQAITEGPNQARLGLMKQLSKNTDSYQGHMDMLAQKYQKAANVAKQQGDPALQQTDKKLALVAEAAKQVSEKINGIPSYKAIMLQFHANVLESINQQVNHIVHNATGYGAHGAKLPPHHTKSPKHTATGGPLGAFEASVVGERGPELFVPFVSGHVIPNNKIGRGGGGGGGGGNITITNWEEGKGFFESIADDSVNASGNHTRKIAKMRRT